MMYLATTNHIPNFWLPAFSGGRETTSENRGRFYFFKFISPEVGIGLVWGSKLKLPLTRSITY